MTVYYFCPFCKDIVEQKHIKTDVLESPPDMVRELVYRHCSKCQSVVIDFYEYEVEKDE